MFPGEIEKFCHKHRHCIICDLNISDSDAIVNFVETHTKIALSGQPNFLGCKIPVVSNLKLDFWKSMLSQYHDNDVCNFLEIGFPIGFLGTLSQSFKPKNNSGAREYPDHIFRYLQKELKFQAIIGPFKSNPFITNLQLPPLNTVPKGSEGDRRIILDLSFPPDNGINSQISKDHYPGEKIGLRYPSVDDLVNIIKKKGRSCLMYKKDLSRAYRQIPIDPGDVHLVGYQWKGHIFFDKVLSMGLRSSAYICQRVTSAVSYMCTQMGYDVLNYIDDFAGAEKEDQAWTAYEALGRLLQACGLQESSEKACAPSTVMSVLGVQFNTVALTLSVTEERVSEILLLVQDWLLKKSASLKDVQSLLGKLHFISACVRPGRIFVSRLLSWLRSFRDINICLEIPKFVFYDLLWWSKFLIQYNGISMMLMDEWLPLTSLSSATHVLLVVVVYPLLIRSFSMLHFHPTLKV